MSEFFLELFSEEIPPSLQISARENLLQNFKHYFDSENINYENQYYGLSTPNRLVIYFKDVQDETLKKSKEIKGPNIKSSPEALEGFLKSNKITKKHLFKRKIDNGEFYFYRSSSKRIKTYDLLKNNIPILLSKINWKKSMRWGQHKLYWARPLKSILAVYNKKTLRFNFKHLKSSNFTYLDKSYERNKKVFKNFSSYMTHFKKSGVFIDQNERKNFIQNKLSKLCKIKKFKLKLNEKLLNEVTNIVEKPNIILCTFDKKFLDIPKEIIITTIEKHQKYFPIYDNDNFLINNFFVVADCNDKKGLIKAGNESVIEARLSDADYFWRKNKSESMFKQVTILKKINYFKDLGNYFDKSQRLKNLSGLISDEFLISKEKIEIASTISKVDLLSNLVSEFPELQGTLGGYFAEVQGFEKDVCLAIKEQYLPVGLNSKVPKNNYSIALSLSDKIDTLVGFFGIDMVPTSSKDPFALRRLAIGLVKIIIENKKSIKLKEIINFSCQIYNSQSIKIDEKKVLENLSKFILERLKNFMKEKGIRQDIIESSVSNSNINKLLVTYTKANILNRLINKSTGIDLIENYKRALNILIAEKVIQNKDITGLADPALFKDEAEKDLYKKINEIKKDFTSIKTENNYEVQLFNLASIKKEINKFFENVKVNDNDEILKKNRLQLLMLLCKTFDNYFNFSKIETSI